MKLKLKQKLLRKLYSLFLWIRFYCLEIAEPQQGYPDVKERSTENSLDMLLVKK